MGTGEKREREGKWEDKKTYSGKRSKKGTGDLEGCFEGMSSLGKWKGGYIGMRKRERKGEESREGGMMLYKEDRVLEGKRDVDGEERRGKDHGIPQEKVIQCTSRKVALYPHRII